MERLRMDQRLAPCVNRNCFPAAWPYKHRLCMHHVEYLRYNGPNTQKAQHAMYFDLHLLPHISLYGLFSCLPPLTKANFLALSAQSAFLSPVRCRLGDLTSLSGFVAGVIDRNKRFFNNRNVTGVKKQIWDLLPALVKQTHNSKQIDTGQKFLCLVKAVPK